MRELPFISVITPTLNAESYLAHFFRSLKTQTYPKKKIEVIIVDGGSTDKTIKIAKKYYARVVKNRYVMAQPGVYVGMQHAKGELVIILPGDNIFRDKNAIEILARIFVKDKKIYGAFPKHDSTKTDSLFTKYINQFTDPLNHYLYGDASNARTFKKLYRTLEHNALYDVYDYKSSSVLPILGLTQGFTIRRNFVKHWKEINDDIAPIMKLIEDDKKIAYVHSVILFHHTVRDLEHFFRKQRWAAQNALAKRGYGIGIRMSKFPLWQRIKLYLFPLYAYSIIVPCVVAFNGFLRDKELIWLFHPFITLITASAIVYEYALFIARQSREVSRL